MTLLAIGILLFAGLHLIKSLAPGFRADWLARLGKNGYRGIFSLLVLGAFTLIIIGWRGAVPAFVYTPPASLRVPALALLLLAFLLLVVSQRQSRLRNLVRHPQLSGVALWGIAHLLLNGDSRALLLFGGMAVWAVLEMIAINRRDGLWIKGATPHAGTDLANLVIAAVVVALAVYLHPWLAGVALTGLLPQ